MEAVLDKTKNLKGHYLLHHPSYSSYIGTIKDNSQGIFESLSAIDIQTNMKNTNYPLQTKRSVFLYLLTTLFIGVIGSIPSSLLFGQSAEAPSIRFGIISDVQYADRDDAGSRNYRGSPAKLAEAVQAFNDHQVDFVINLGDFIDSGASGFDTLLSITDRLAMPLYHVLGNHDFTESENPRAYTLAMLGMENGYYSIVHANWRFIVLDGNDISLYARLPGTPQHEEALAKLDKQKDKGLPNAVEWNGAIGGQQLDWLAQELDDARRLGQRCIVLCHFPLHTDDGYHELWNAEEVLAMLGQSSHVDAYFNGHVHKNNYEYRQGIHFLTFAGVVERGSNAFAIANIYADRLVIEGFGEQESRVIEITKPHSN